MHRDGCFVVLDISESEAMNLSSPEIVCDVTRYSFKLYCHVTASFVQM
jgi:hypothetical protein